jgi:DNA-directed RNA polymerase specialized sigma24 family protein
MRPPEKSSVLTSNLRRGEVAAWACLQAEIDKFLSRILGRLGEADQEEVLCDTVSYVWQSLRRLREDRKLIPFALTIARRLARKWIRQRSRFERLRSEPAAEDDCADRQIEALELHQTIVRAVERSNERLFRLLYVLGADSLEVQNELGVTGPGLRKRKHVLHKTLRRAIERYESGRPAEEGPLP